MTHQQPNPERMLELLTDAAQNWVSLAASTAWVDLFGSWRGTNDLLDFAVRYPTRRDQQTAGAVPQCVVLVEYARWALTASAPDEAVSHLKQQAEAILQVDRPSGLTELVDAITHTIIAGVAAAANDVSTLHRHIGLAAQLYDRQWPLTKLRMAHSPLKPLSPKSATPNYDIKDQAHRVLALAEQCGAFGDNGVTISTWLVLHRLLSRIFGSDNTDNVNDNELRMLLYNGRDHRGQVGKFLVETVKAPTIGVYFDPLSFGITRVNQRMGESIRQAFRCCRQTVLEDRCAIRISGQLPLTLATLGGGSAGGLFAAAMIVTARLQPLDSTRSASCVLKLTDDQRNQDEQIPLDPHDVWLSSVGGYIRKIDEAWQKEHGIEEVYLCRADAEKWLAANPNCPLPRVTPVDNLHQLLAGLTINQNYDRELERHARWAHSRWERVKQAIRQDTTENDRDHRFDCYVEPSLRLEGPFRKPETDVEPEQNSDHQSRRRPMTGREREEFSVPGDATADRDEPLLNLLEFSLRATPFPDSAEDGNGDADPEQEALPAWVRPGRALVIYDNAGAGKTVCSHRLQHLLTDPNHRERLFGHRQPPLVVRLDGRWRREHIDKGRPLKISELLVSSFCEDMGRHRPEHRALVEDTIRHALNERRVVLILDGFDQFLEDERQHVVNVFQNHSEAKQCHWIITSRVHTIDELRSDESFFGNDNWTRVRIDPFSTEQQDRYFHRFDANDRKIGDLWLAVIGGASNREAMDEILRLPMVLSMIRELIDDADRSKHLLPVISTLSQLYLVTSRKLLARAIEKNRKEVEQRLLEKQIAIPSLTAEQQLTELEHVLTLMAFQLMLMEEYNGQVSQSELERFMSLCRDRYFHEIDQQFMVELPPRKREELQKRLERHDAIWTWSVEVLKTIELSHRSVTEAFSDAGLAFRSLKMLECHAARYLTSYATEWDVFADAKADDLLVVDPQDEKQDLSTLCAWNYTTHPQWKETWELAIEMPQQSVAAVDADGTITKAVLNPDVTCRSLSALFRLPKPYEARDIRPTELIYRAWHLFEFDLPLLKERKFLIDGNIVRGCDLPESQLRHLGQQLLLGVRQSRQPVVGRRTDVLTEFRATSGSLTEQIKARLDTVLTNNGQRVPLPADPEARSSLLAQWRQQSSTEKSLTFLQCPPQSLRDEFASLPQEQQTGDLNPCVNNAIEAHETDAVEPCLMQATTVTRAMYAVFDQRFWESQLKHPLCTMSKTDHARADLESVELSLPILCVNWFDAWAYCKWLGRSCRLPTSFEWEFGCRGATLSAFYTGSELSQENANIHMTDSSNSEEALNSIVASFATVAGDPTYPCNTYGLFDLHGNAGEWCLDSWFGVFSIPENTSRIVRGGSFNELPKSCRSDSVSHEKSSDRLRDVGFRIVSDRQ